MGGGVDPQPTYEMVDLGLPSGLKWANMNIGAKSETDYGLYFQWGDVEGRTADEISSKPCDWKTAPFNNGASNYNKAYFASVSGDVCPNYVLAVEYDAATVKMGDGWRMPTEADYYELFANTTNEWTQVNGVNGRKFTSKTDASKYIFIPASGCANGGSMFDVGSTLYVWSSTLNISSPEYAWRLDGNSSYCGVTYGRSRWFGFSLRGVCK